MKIHVYAMQVNPRTGKSNVTVKEVDAVVTTDASWVVHIGEYYSHEYFQRPHVLGNIGTVYMAEYATVNEDPNHVQVLTNAITKYVRESYESVTSRYDRVFKQLEEISCPS